jgi:hypothetical protein
MPRSSRLFLATLVQIKSGTRRTPHRCAKSELPCQAHLPVNGPPPGLPGRLRAQEKSLKVMVGIRLLLPDGDIQVLRSSSPTPRAGSPDGWPISEDRRARAPRPRAITSRCSVNVNSARLRVEPERPHHLRRLPFEPDPGLPALVPDCIVDSPSEAWQARNYNSRLSNEMDTRLAGSQVLALSIIVPGGTPA